MPYSEEMQLAIAAAREAAQLCQSVRAEIPEAIEKEDRSPVTVADYGSQALICRAIADRFPQDPIVGEEAAAALRSPESAPVRDRVAHFVRQCRPDATPEQVLDWIDRGQGTPSDRFWTLDPIDGTKGFLRGDQYAIAIALIENGSVQLGILGCPALPLDLDRPDGETGVLFAAVRGQGTQMMPLSGGEARPIRVVSSDDRERLRFVESVETAHGDRELQESIAKTVGIVAPSARLDSQAKYGVVASGQAGLYLRLPSPKRPDYREKIWDHAAGCIVVEEAGGRVSDMHGKPLDFSQGSKLDQNRGVVASNGAIHEAVIEALRSRS